MLSKARGKDCQAGKPETALWCHIHTVACLHINTPFPCPSLSHTHTFLKKNRGKTLVVSNWRTQQHKRLSDHTILFQMHHRKPWPRLCSTSESWMKEEASLTPSLGRSPRPLLFFISMVSESKIKVETGVFHCLPEGYTYWLGRNKNLACTTAPDRGLAMETAGPPTPSR